MFERFKAWSARTWKRFKLWVIALLVSIGVIVPALGIDTDFTWTNPTTRIDGTPLPIEEIAEVRLFCDGNQVGSATGGVENLTVDLSPGTYDCFATTVDVFGLESTPSNTITVDVVRAIPNPPVLNDVN